MRAAMRPRLRMRQVINLANGSTLAGLGVAALGGARIARSADGLFTGTGYRLPVPPAPAFCLGNVIVIRGDGIDPDSGEVTDIVNARAARERHIGDPQAIMNGIAALPGEGEFLLTGKGWRSIRHVRLKLARDKAALHRVLGGLGR